jgi:hypothetical protein
MFQILYVNNKRLIKSALLYTASMPVLYDYSPQVYVLLKSLRLHVIFL